MTTWGHYRVNLRRKVRENGKTIRIENVELHKDSPSWGRGWWRSVQVGNASVYTCRCFKSDEDCEKYGKKHQTGTFPDDILSSDDQHPPSVRTAR